jgi:hypothetical protein
MATKRVVISKINGTGVVRQNTTSKVYKDQIENKSKAFSCSIDSDSLTSYVQKKEWVITKSDYLYPPYVECEYVI